MIEFSDELINFIFKMNKRELFDMSKLYEIDPYDDVEIPQNDLSRIIEISNYILDKSLLQAYEEPEEGNQMIKDLLEIAGEAQSRDLGLISIGD